MLAWTLKDIATAMRTGLVMTVQNGWDPAVENVTEAAMVPTPVTASIARLMPTSTSMVSVNVIHTGQVSHAMPTKAPVMKNAMDVTDPGS